MEQEENSLETTFDCDCGGQRSHLFKTEDEDSVYDFYKCQVCGDITHTDNCK